MRALAIGAATPGLASSQAIATAAGVDAVRGGDLVQRVEHAPAALVEVAASACSARGLSPFAPSRYLPVRKPLASA